MDIFLKCASKAVSLLTVTCWSRQQKPHESGCLSVCLGMQNRALGAGFWWKDWSEFPYEQGGSSLELRGLQGGTVLRDRNAKMEGS